MGSSPQVSSPCLCSQGIFILRQPPALLTYCAWMSSREARACYLQTCPQGPFLRSVGLKTSGLCRHLMIAITCARACARF